MRFLPWINWCIKCINYIAIFIDYIKSSANKLCLISNLTFVSIFVFTIKIRYVIGVCCINYLLWFIFSNDKLILIIAVKKVLRKKNIVVS